MLITKEEIQRYADGYEDTPTRSMARMLLASIQQEPVGYFGRFDPDDEDLIDQCSANLKGAFPLYSTPPAPISLPAQHWEELCHQNPGMSIGDAIIRAAWWNHCAAMLQGKDEPV